MTQQTDAFYLPTASGNLFCILTRPPPACTVVGALLYLHPFAEELNKTRRMAALGARMLAAQGYVVLQVDLRGCGDSAGDFADASWSGWCDDALYAARWLQQKKQGPFWIGGLRAGALIASVVLPHLPDTVGVLLWQPVLNGQRHLTQFLRLKLAENMHSPERADTHTLRAQLAAGQALEIAGYSLSPTLAHGLDDATFTLPPGYTGRVVCLEINASNAPSPAVNAAAMRWREVGARVEAVAVTGPDFWQTREIETCPALLAETAQRMGVR